MCVIMAQTQAGHYSAPAWLQHTSKMGLIRDLAHGSGAEQCTVGNHELRQVQQRNCRGHQLLISFISPVSGPQYTRMTHVT